MNESKNGAVKSTAWKKVKVLQLFKFIGSTHSTPDTLSCLCSVTRNIASTGTICVTLLYCKFFDSGWRCQVHILKSSKITKEIFVILEFAHLESFLIGEMQWYQVDHVLHIRFWNHVYFVIKLCNQLYVFIIVIVCSFESKKGMGKHI